MGQGLLYSEFHREAGMRASDLLKTLVQAAFQLLSCYCQFLGGYETNYVRGVFTPVFIYQKKFFIFECAPSHTALSPYVAGAAGFPAHVPQGPGVRCPCETVPVTTGEQRTAEIMGDGIDFSQQEQFEIKGLYH